MPPARYSPLYAVIILFQPHTDRHTHTHDVTLNTEKVVALRAGGIAGWWRVGGIYIAAWWHNGALPICKLLPLVLNTQSIAKDHIRAVLL